MTDTLIKLADKIDHHKTKEYFNEVLSSYRSENYRSAVVMLYTVVICDLIFKLNDLKDIHKDQKAIKILKDLDTEKDEAPVSPAWENTLIEKAFKEAKLLENDIYTHIITLKNYRNLSAHPVLNSLDILFRPNKELARSLMINMLEGLLTKSPIFTKNVFSPFMEEIERIKNDFSTEERLETYIKSKFLIHFNKDLTEYIFKNLWKLVFKNDGEREQENREINYKVLLIIYKNNEGIISEFISKEATFFSDIKDDDSLILNKIIDFLSKNPNVYSMLKEHTQEMLKIKITSEYRFVIKSPFLSNSIEHHFNSIDNRIHLPYGPFFNTPYTQKYLFKQEDINYLYGLTEDQATLESFYDLMISHYYHSDFYDGAERCFEICIRPYYKEFNKEQMQRLLSESNSNPQCYQARYTNHKILLSKAKELLGDDVESKYKNLFK